MAIMVVNAVFAVECVIYVAYVAKSCLSMDSAHVVFIQLIILIRLYIKLFIKLV